MVFWGQMHKFYKDMIVQMHHIYFAKNLQQKVGDITYICFDLSCPLSLLPYPQGGGRR